MAKIIAAVARLRDFAPYIVMAVIIPGGTVMAPLLYLRERRRQSSGR
jgi:hypothetical protein